MEQHIIDIRKGWEAFSDNPYVNKATHRVQKSVTFIWLAVGMIPGWVIMSLLLIYSSLWDIFIIAAGTSPDSEYANVSSGMDIITQNTEIQLLIAMSVLTFGVILAMARNKYLLTIGAILVLIYTYYLMVGTLDGRIDIRGWRAVMYLLATSGGVLIASYSSWLYSQQSDVMLDLKNEMLAQRDVSKDVSRENTQLKEKLNHYKAIIDARNLDAQIT